MYTRAIYNEHYICTYTHIWSDFDDADNDDEYMYNQITKCGSF